MDNFDLRKYISESRLFEELTPLQKYIFNYEKDISDKVDMRAIKGLENANDDDVIIISDLDEIPNPKKLINFKKSMRYAVFKQLHFYYKLNLHSQKNPYWFGSRICVKKYLKSPQWLRNLKFKKRPFWRIDKLDLNNILKVLIN